MVLAQAGMSLEEFLKLPEQKPALEFEDGRIIQKPMPKGRHSRLQRELGDRLERAGAQGNSAAAFTELRYTYGGRSYLPDVSVYRRERLPLDASGEIVDDFFIPPDIAVEIVSPEQSVNALIRRCTWYVDNGVLIALLVDPVDRSVVLFRPGRAPQALTEEDPIDLSEVLPDFHVTVQELFDSLKLG